MLNRKQIFDTITNDGKIDVDGTEAQRIINHLMYLQSQNLQQTPCTTKLPCGDCENYAEYDGGLKYCSVCGTKL